MTKRIGIITSGGDCAGLNATIRAIVHAAKEHHGWDVIGIEGGGHGLLTSPLRYRELDSDFHGINHVLLRLGGTILGTTTKGDPLAYKMKDGTVVDRSQEFIKNYHSLNLDALIITGGDGSFKIMHEIASRGDINIVCIPKTIDNDIGLTEAIGFETAVSVATEALDRLQPTAASHDRVMVLEVMGRDAGHISLNAGIAGGADVILLPEIPFSLESVTKKIKSVMSSGRGFALVVVSEAARLKNQEAFMVQYSDGSKRYGGVGNFLANEIDKKMGIDARVIALGHVQRGGQPVAQDRLLAAAFGVRAVELVAEGKFNRMVAWQNREVVDVSIKDAIKTYQQVDLNSTMVRTARGLGICLGD